MLPEASGCQARMVEPEVGSHLRDTGSAAFGRGMNF